MIKKNVYGINNFLMTRCAVDANIINTSLCIMAKRTAIPIRVIRISNGSDL